MHVKLKVLRGASAGKEVVVRGPRFFIGRSEECHLRANSDAISRRHCAITVQDDAVRIRDLGSRNGTFVNGTRIDGDHRLEMGDQLRVGPLEFLVTYLVQAKAPVGQVTGKGPSDDMDGLIGDWLSEADEQEKLKPGIAGETREFRLDETSRIQPQAAPDVADNPAESPAKPEVAAENDAEDSEETDAAAGAGRASPGTRRSSQKVAPKDTQEAAAQTLRKFFNRGT